MYAREERMEYISHKEKMERCKNISAASNN